MCTSPHRVFKTGLKTETGKDLLFFDTHYPHTDLISKDHAEHVLKVSIPYDPRYMHVVDGRIFLDTFLDVPCGKCDECALSNARHWAQRCMMEMQNCPGPCWFLTLTFDDAHLPDKVSTSDVSKFLKRLRRRLDKPGLRFFACGEYGEKSGRPHYHMILFDAPLPDIYLFDSRKNLRCSALIDEIWPYGMHVLADVTQESINYVARYTSKKSGAKKGFVQMSRRPGIGFGFLSARPHFFVLDYLPVNDRGRLLRAPLPRYFEKIFPDLPWNDLKAERLERSFLQRNLECACYGLSPLHLDDYKRDVAATKRQRLAKKEI